MSESNRIALTTRDVSGKVSLMTFEDSGIKTVATVLSKEDLEDLIYGLGFLQLTTRDCNWARNLIALRENFEQLVKEAFP